MTVKSDKNQKRKSDERRGVATICEQSDPDSVCSWGHKWHTVHVGQWVPGPDRKARHYLGVGGRQRWGGWWYASHWVSWPPRSWGWGNWLSSSRKKARKKEKTPWGTPCLYTWWARGEGAAFRVVMTTVAMTIVVMAMVVMTTQNAHVSGTWPSKHGGLHASSHVAKILGHITLSVVNGRHQELLSCEGRHFSQKNWQVSDEGTDRDRELLQS